MTQLPTGWTTAKIEALLSVLADGRLLTQGWSPRCLSEPAREDEWAVLKTTAIQDGYFLSGENKKLPPHMAPQPSLEVQPGDLLLTCAGPRRRCGVICLVRATRQKLMISGKMYRFRVPEEHLLPTYVEYFLRDADTQRAIDKLKTGISDSGLNLTHERFLNLDIKVPPLPEQRRIVAKIYSLSAKAKRVRDQLDHIPRLVEKYKQAVLDVSFTALGERKKLEELVDPERGIPYGIVQTGKPTASGVPTVRGGDIKRFRVERSQLKLVDHSIEESFRRTRLRGGEVLLAIRGSVGEPCVVPPEMCGSNISREVAMIPVRNNIDPHFVMFYLASAEARKFIFRNVKGVAQQGINLADLRELPTPSPKREQQSRTAHHIQRAFEWIDRLASEAASARKLTDHLDQAVLAKAFRGELVPQDPSDEPASTLLERIKAERQATRTPHSRKERQKAPRPRLKSEKLEI